MQSEDSYSEESSFDDEYQSIAMGENDMENQAFIGEKDIKKVNLSPIVSEYFSDYKKLAKSKFMKLFMFKEQVEENKSICARNIVHGQTIAQCYDCATDNSCIQCMDCFKNSNHEGHKVVIKKAYGGCCDCGDVQAWKKEGFCKKHTGESIQIQIDPKQEEHFLTQMRQVFFLLFRECIQQNINFSRDFSNQLLANLCYMNQKGVYYNKLTCLLFSSKLAQDSIVSKNVNSRNILTNILSPRIARHLNMDKWIELFFNMFQYYPFKKLLLSTYMSNFSLIYSEKEGMERGSSISCQLLTSYQLVRDYALQKGSIPMGSDINIDKLRNFDNTFYMLYHDLNYITKLQTDTPLIYFKFHTQSQQGILKPFEYRKIIKNQQDKFKQQFDILQLARFAKYFQLEFKALELMTKIAGILQKEKNHLMFIIKTLHQQALKQQNQRKMIIFKPLTRALTIFLFAYFDLDLKNVTYEKNKTNIDNLVNYIGNNEGSFGNDVPKLFKTCVQTYLFHAKILAESGLNSTLYGYIYFYKLKSRIVSSVDGLSVKLLSLMHTWPKVNKSPIILPQDHIWSSITIQQNAAQKQEIQVRMKHLQFMLSELNLATTSLTNQVYTAHQINPECGLYQEYIETVLLKLLKQQKTNITLGNVKQWSEWFFHPRIDLAQNYLKKLSTYDKIKKAFIYNSNVLYEKQQSLIEFIDYNDFRCNITNKSEFVSPEVTLQLIRQSGNEMAYDNLWSIQTINNFAVKVIEYMQNLLKNSLDSETLQSLEVLSVKLKPLFNQLMKALYLKNQLTHNKEKIQFIIQTISKMTIEKYINPFYQHKLLHLEKIQQEKHSHQYQHNIQRQHDLMINSPQKQSLKKTKSNEQQQRKKKLKQKMQMKKKLLKQKYQKQTVNFQQLEKKKLQSEDIQEQVEHKLECIICKNDQQENLIFLVNITYKNHQKLLKLGEGVTCLSLSSCYHAIDYACYKKLQSEIGSRRRPMIKCPFCKIPSNTFLPIKASSKLVIEALSKLQVVLFTQKSFDEINISQQIIKSFYHFALLAYLDPQKTLHRRLRVYKIVFEILKQNTKSQYLQKVYSLFVNNTMNLNPSTTQQMRDKKKAQRLLQLTMYLQNNSNINLQDLNENQIEQLMNMIYQQQDDMSGEQSSGNNGFLYNVVNRFKSTLLPKNKKVQQKQSPKSKQNKMSLIFKQVMNRLFKELNIKIVQQKKQRQIIVQKHELQNKMQQQEPLTLALTQQHLPQSIQLCFKRLFDPKFIYHHMNIYQDLNDNNSLLKLRDLPINFKPLGLCNKCQQCSEISSSMTLCLLCDWQGCLRNCLALKNKQKRNEQIKQSQQKEEKCDIIKKQGGTFNHSKHHGEQSLFLILQNCQIANITVGSQLTNYGCVYKDEWGNDFNRKQQWEKFFLDEGELNKAKLAFLHQH